MIYISAHLSGNGPDYIGASYCKGIIAHHFQQKRKIKNEDAKKGETAGHECDIRLVSILSSLK